jgi:hypothetical protein
MRAVRSEAIEPASDQPSGVRTLLGEVLNGVLCAQRPSGFGVTLTGEAPQHGIDQWCHVWAAGGLRQLYRALNGGVIGHAVEAGDLISPDAQDVSQVGLQALAWVRERRSDPAV